MQKREGQEFDLLESLREASRQGQKIVKEALEKCTEDEVIISGALVKHSELDELFKLLQKTVEVKTIGRMKKLLNEDSIPIELVVLSDFWGNFQDLIYELDKK